MQMPQNSEGPREEGASEKKLPDEEGGEDNWDAAKLMKDKNWPPEVVQHFKDIGVLPDGESIISKGSFKEIKEQWVRDNLKVL